MSMQTARARQDFYSPGYEKQSRENANSSIDRSSLSYESNELNKKEQSTVLIRKIFKTRRCGSNVKTFSHDIIK